ncbi:pilus assembly protein TadG-related protein [Mesorhizobium sp. M1050]|uniref:pilus assembly protein TadG-related protein n=1 Tax=Mesorhizobium sp. M1050 TaxID=2957051 RepID=UPI00333CA3F0
MLRIIRAFWRDQRGVALVLVAIMLPAIVGFSLLVIDMSRVNNLQNDLQKGADSFSIAAAAELDGKPDSIIRADRALSTLVSSQYSFSGTAGPLTLQSAGVTRRYLKSLPATDNLPIVAANVITDEVTDASKARFIEVRVTPVGFNAIFPASFSSWTVGAVAVAGFTSSVCDFTPMFICNPYGSSDALAASLTGHKRAMMALKKQNGGGNAQYGPGDYGFLDTPSGSQSTPALTEMFAATKPLGCYANDGVNTKPGNIPPVNDGINVRFDIYPNGNNYPPASYPPAPNTRKGMVTKIQGNNCSYVAPNSGQASSYKAVPKDNCFTAGTCSVNNRLGTGDWDRPGYWSVNHPSTSYASTGLDANASRYEVYQWEMAHANDHGTEPTTPACHTPSTDVKRRIINVAIIDCVANPVSGNGGDYPVDTFASFFLTEPAGGPPNADIYGEIVDITGRGGQGTLDNFLRDEAQLYR